ncbi:PP2C family protein-serine/threonine phosphatase [Paractinoplanes atraurantiacus]|uniref:Serine phosphatase RsbU, regulator of sigma subunit n=1 Tax=Paractinoplanes atraurantiacus TaxID=1036182 RepID=A0A285HPJ2_9ACTN|nr:PP2C family protein-serine/threonine phosphatase [Actinoplanes atraurantiacus]SNY37617.1 Serine phosphatase RsbU, regulator of sigma subunit [Actinoplanes atraurantiacus]
MLSSMEAVRRLMDLRHRGRAEDLPAVLAEAAPLLDAEAASVLLIDYGQVALHPLRGTTTGTTTTQTVEDTPAGRAFTTAEQQWRESDDGGKLWLPLLHGAERLGVLEFRVKAYPAASTRHDLEVIAALVAELIASRRFYGDAVEHTRRRLPMQLPAEIIWNQLPPLTFAVDGTMVTAVLEPCYEVGGDAFDYAANGDVLHVALFDTVGHGISASALTTLTLNTYRNARRSGLSLIDTCRSIDKWVHAQYPGAFVTALLSELDMPTGTYRRISAGHPAEIFLRDGRMLPALPTPNTLPLGLGHMLSRPPEVIEERLRPGDALVFYTDGITEARDASGALFGVERLGDFMLGALRDGSPAPEAMRRLIQTIVSYEDGELRDDATAAMLQWRRHDNEPG